MNAHYLSLRLFGGALLLSLFLFACKSKVEKKDKTLEEMQAMQDGHYVPILKSADTVILYKTIDTVALHLNVFYPNHKKPDTLTPCMIFFFHGGFIHGSPDMFEPWAAHFASKGLITICADYRVIARNDVTGIECIKDVNSAMRWLRQYGSSIQVDTGKIIASGGSAGGALCITAVLANPMGNEATDNLEYSTKPNYMVLYNPVVNLEEFGFRIRKFVGNAPVLSPLKNLNTPCPPTIVMHGTNDELAGYTFVKQWVEGMQQLHCDVKLVTYEGEGHGFYQPENAGGKYYQATLTESENWLREHGLIQ